MFAPTGVAVGVGIVAAAGIFRIRVADAGSVALTAALARALRRIAGELACAPSVGLREAAARDVLHLLPVSGKALRPPWSTHPPLESRIERRERLERALHAARLPANVARERAER